MEVKRTSSGSFKNIQKFFDRVKNRRFYDRLESYGQAGVDALAAATPKDTGTTAQSWTYEVEKNGDHAEVSWSNTNVQDGWFNVASALQHGHGTRNGGWVEGRDYINPAMKPLFDQIEEGVWGEIKNS